MNSGNKMPADKSDEIIDVLSDTSIKKWTQRFNVTEQQLRNAVFIEGPLVKNVEAFFRRHGLPGSQPPE